MMLLHMRSVLNKGGQPEFVQTMDVSHLLADRSEVVASGPLHINVKAQEVEGAVEVSGHLELELTQACSRCLEQVTDKLHIPFSETFLLESAATDVNEEDDHVHVVSEDRIDLVPYIEENVVVALPYVTLCSEDCKGLCPACGKNRNADDCGCVIERIDPRLAGLADFFKQNDQ